jgi:hypothetical protein
MANSILVIQPYWHSGTWVFDDPAVGLTREPFVSGVPEMINRLVKHIPSARSGFRLLFSTSPFPGATRFNRIGGDLGGMWYCLADEPLTQGWLCPALFKYFPEAPEAIYAKAEPLGG